MCFTKIMSTSPDADSNRVIKIEGFIGSGHLSCILPCLSSCKDSTRFRKDCHLPDNNGPKIFLCVKEVGEGKTIVFAQGGHIKSRFCMDA